MKRFLALLLTLLLLPSCAAKKTSVVRVATLSGPTGFGMATLFDDPKYEFTVCTDPTEIVALVANGSVDIAAVPTNLAATLYQKTGGNVRLVGINTLGVLHVLDATGTVHSFADLANKTVYATGEGSSPEFVLRYLLKENGIDANVVFKAEHSELATLCIGGQAPIAVLPEPFVTNVRNKAAFTDAVDLADVWKSTTNSELPMGGVIVTADFMKTHADELDAFMQKYKESVDFVNGSPKEAGALIEAHGILPSAAVAEEAIPHCNIVLLTGERAKEIVEPYFAMLYEADPKSVGGKLPDAALYGG